MSLLKQIASSNYISVNKTLIKAVGLEEAVILGELCSEYEFWESNNQLTDDTMFYCSVSKLEENTGLSDRKQRRVIKKLEELGLLKTELKGIPATRYFKLNESMICEFLQIERTSSCKTQELDVAKRNSSNNIYNNTNNNISISKDIDKNFLKQPTTISISKTKKKSLYEKCLDKINEFTDDDTLRNYLVQCLKMFLENSRESGSPFYSNTFIGKLNKLKKLSEDTYVQREIVLQTLDNGWNGFYELKKNYSKKTGDVRTDIEGLSTKTIPRANTKDIERRLANGEIEQF